MSIPRKNQRVILEALANDGAHIESRSAGRDDQLFGGVKFFLVYPTGEEFSLGTWKFTIMFAEKWLDQHETEVFRISNKGRAAIRQPVPSQDEPS